MELVPWVTSAKHQWHGETHGTSSNGLDLDLLGAAFFASAVTSPLELVP